MKKIIVFMVVLIATVFSTKQVHAQMYREYSDDLVYMYIDDYKMFYTTGSSEKLPCHRLCICNLSDHKIEVRVLVQVIRESDRRGREGQMKEITETIAPKGTEKIFYFGIDTRYVGEYYYANYFRVLSCKIVK